MSCPGPDRATECDARACRYGGCQGRMPAWRCDLCGLPAEDCTGHLWGGAMVRAPVKRPLHGD